MRDESLAHVRSETESPHAGPASVTHQIDETVGDEPSTARRFTMADGPTLVPLEQKHVDTIVRLVPGGIQNVQDVYPLSPLQEGMLFHRLMNEQNDTYVLSTLLELGSDVQVDSLLDALQRVIERHDILRSAVLWEQLPQPLQVVYRYAQLPLHRLVLDQHRDPIEQLKEYLKPGQDALDLQRAPLGRLYVATDVQDGKWYALLQVHHLVCDHQSMRQVVAETIACLAGAEHELPVSTSYRDYVVEALAEVQKEESQAFFREKLGQITEPTAPFGLLDVHGDGRRIEEASKRLEGELADEIRAAARRVGVSAARLFHAAWALVVAHTSGRDEVVYGTVLLAARQKSVRERRMLGMSVNTLPLRLQLTGLTAQELVEHTHRELALLSKYEHVPLTLAQSCSGIAGTAPLFTALLNYRHSATHSDIERASRIGVRVLARGEAWTNYPVTVLVDDFGLGFELTAQTDQSIDPGRVITYLETAVRSLVATLQQSPQTAALTLPILSEGERRQVIELFNSQRAYAQEKLIHQLFEDQVARTPDAVAATYEGQSLTYAELNGRANRLARCLREKGVGPDQLVALCVERSLEMLVGLIAILKAGGAYVPLDPDYPRERLDYMVKDAAPCVLLIQKHLRDRLSSAVSEVIALDGGQDEMAAGEANVDAPDLCSHHLAYVIYTSGSTGKPKGVMVEHRNVTRLFDATEQWFDFNRRDVWTLFHSVAFDFSVWEMWGALLYGGRLVVVPHATARSPREFYQLLCEERVTVLNQTPSAFAQLVDAQSWSAARHSLRVVIFGGEALVLQTLQAWVERNGVERPKLVNMYGITETTVHVTYRALSREEIESERSSPVGKPIPDLSTYLLDCRGQPVPIGVAGEIYVGGAGVARGYLNRSALTAERFIVDPFDARSLGRLYRSGDLGRWRADGTLEYLGRNDGQVKIRGYRIELGEIGAQLARHRRVKDAVVIAREDIAGEKQLVAYLTLHEPSDLRVEELRTHLAAVLPEYMVPSAFVTLESLPLTPNGKLDRRALPIPDVGAYASREYQAPHGAIEEALAGIWREVLRVKRIGRKDNFFQLGGHSLMATRVFSRMRDMLQVDLPLRAIFDAPTVEQLSVRVAAERQGSAEGLAEGLRQQISEMDQEAVLARIAELEKELAHATANG